MRSLETNDMIDKENLDVRTITLGISLAWTACDYGFGITFDRQRIYNRITTVAKDLGRDRRRQSEKEFGSSDCKQTNFGYSDRFELAASACKTPEDFVAYCTDSGHVQPKR